MFYLLALPGQFLRSLLVFGGLWLLILLSATAQPAPPSVRIEHLPSTGLLLSKGWRYHAGDNPTWARPDFDDTAWDTLNPTRPRSAQPQAVQTGISWLRLRFRLGDSLRRHDLLVKAREMGAVEVYLNGQLVLQDGRLDADPARVRPRSTFHEPGAVSAGGNAEQVLAVRYAPWRPLLLLGSDWAPLLQLSLITPRQQEKFIVQARDASRAYLVLMGTMGLLLLLHLAFFYFNPAQRANRYFARSALAATVACLSAYYQYTFSVPSLTTLWLVYTLSAALAGLIELWMARALYELFHVRPGRIYTALWVAYGVLVLLRAIYSMHPVASVVFALLLALPFAEQLRLTGQALRRRQRGAGIIAAGFGAGLLLTLFLAGLFVWYPALLLLQNILIALSLALPALGISLHLAREFALDSQLLQIKLGEVERLSAQTLAQEQEKQALLAQQNDTLEQQVSARTGELQRSLTELRATQAQLIQKEKMASLGELTAGIAHEIQNPLNFVNNFSEVSAELVAELREERAKGAAADTELEEDLLTDLDRNLTKITQHGQRAAGIVRGMLEHSRASTGERQPTDMNALADEYLRLAYHGLRAKDKTFNAALETDFAPGLPLVEAMASDLSRVLLNLFNNAFYAVQQRQLAAETGYQPAVSVSTRLVGDKVQILVSDNGMGMTAAVQQKIFQPFFTTKPTGEGTGLGLSLSHDIIVQGHGGTLTVQSQSGQGTTFTTCLPISAA